MSEQKKGNTEATVLGLPEVAHDTTNPTLDQVTAPSLAPVASPPPPPRTRTGAGAIPRAEPSRRPSRQAVRVTEPTTDPRGEQTVEPLRKVPEKEPFEWTMPRVAAVTAAVCFAFVMAWVFWPSNKPARPTRPVVEEPAPVADVAPVAKPQPRPVAVAPQPVAPKKPTFALDATKNVIDPYAAHLDDLELDPAHKYRLKIASDDGRLGTALARLDEKNGWGVMRKMASHAALQFGGAKALRMHCDPGSHFTAEQTFPLELTDLATKKSIPLALKPSQHCWDFEVARMMELGEGVKKRVRVPTDATVKLGDQVPLRVAYILEALGETKQWRTGVLQPGESLLAEGRLVRFAILDAYAGDNEGTLELELLGGDTESSGISTSSGAQFVPVVPK